jgi:hypothetical protein|tara:strand:- start:273 stop:545 length:273 start_codon:yes stop_codon:yes gene_type:complete
MDQFDDMKLGVNCPVCSKKVPVAFMVLNSRVEGTLIMIYARCKYCYEMYRDKRSVIGAINLSLKAFAIARLLGLIDLGDIMDELGIDSTG